MAAMPRYRTAYNPTDRPVTIDVDGRQVAGGDYRPVLASDDLVRDHVDAGRLIFVDRPRGGGEDVTDEAAAAFDDTDALNEADDPEAIAEVADEVGATPTAAARKATARTQEAKAR